LSCLQTKHVYTYIIFKISVHVFMIIFRWVSTECL